MVIKWVMSGFFVLIAAVVTWLIVKAVGDGKITFNDIEYRRSYEPIGNWFGLAVTSIFLVIVIHGLIEYIPLI